MVGHEGELLGAGAELFEGFAVDLVCAQGVVGGL